MSIIEDRTAYFADFGVDAQIAGEPVRVIFDNEFLASMDVESSNPVALALTSDVAAVAHGAAVSIPAGEFTESFSGTVIEHKPDGTGFSIIELEAS